MRILARGIICALLVAFVAAAAGAAPLEWPALADQYKYDQAAPLNVELGTETAGLLGTEFPLKFTSANGQRVPGLLLLPPAGAGKAPYPCVLILHGLGGSKKDARALAPLLSKGYMALALDAQYHGDRKQEGKELFSADLAGLQQGFIQTIIDYRRAMDYLATRPDVDAKRIGLVGASMGAIMGSVLSGVDSRVKATVLLVGGGDWQTMLGKSTNPAAVKMREAMGEKPDLSKLDPIDPVHYIEHVSPRPLLMQNASKDDVVPPACAQALWDRAKDPKAIDWYATGHTLDDPAARMAVFMKIMDWLGKNL